MEECLMLVLSRKINESIIIAGGIKVTVVKIDGNKVRLAFEAPPEVSILREELHNLKKEFDLPVEADEPALMGAV
jgi:carbon storage regulator